MSARNGHDRRNSKSNNALRRYSPSLSGADRRWPDAKVSPRGFEPLTFGSGERTFNLAEKPNNSLLESGLRQFYRDTCPLQVFASKCVFLLVGVVVGAKSGRSGRRLLWARPGASDSTRPPSRATTAAGRGVRDHRPESREAYLPGRLLSYRARAESVARCLSETALSEALPADWRARPVSCFISATPKSTAARRTHAAASECDLLGLTQPEARGTFARPLRC